MKRTIGTLIHPDNLNVGSVYFLKHDLLGEAEVEYEGENTFLVMVGRLHSRLAKRSWSKQDRFHLLHYDGAHFYEPAG